MITCARARSLDVLKIFSRSAAQLSTLSLPPFEYTPPKYDGPSKDVVMSLRKQFLNPGTDSTHACGSHSTMPRSTETNRSLVYLLSHPAQAGRAFLTFKLTIMWCSILARNIVNAWPKFSKPLYRYLTADAQSHATCVLSVTHILTPASRCSALPTLQDTGHDRQWQDAVPVRWNREEIPGRMIPHPCWLQQPAYNWASPLLCSTHVVFQIKVNFAINERYWYNRTVHSVDVI